jgi:hypothetical protein
MSNAFSRRTLLQSAALLAAARQISCATEPARGEDTRASREPQLATGDYDAFACAAVPTAYVVPGASAAAFDALAGALEAAGFSVAKLALDQSPMQLRGLIVIPSHASASADYASYMASYASDLYGFVDSANVLLQLTQDEAAEETPPFLPTTHSVQRHTRPIEQVKVNSQGHGLLRDMTVSAGVLDWETSVDEVSVFVRQAGFELVLIDEHGKYPLLLEGAYGQGRIVLSALPFDAPVSDAQRAVSSAFFANLLEHVQIVCDRAAPAVQLGDSAAGVAFTPGSSMIAVLPDTQVYSLRVPGMFNVQTSFLRMNAQKLDIKYALHLGDIVNNNTRIEWERASASMSLLHGAIPYALAPGNHDYGPSGDASTRDTYMNEYFSYEQSAAMPTFGGAYEMGKLDNSYHLFSIQGRDFIVMALEWAPRDEVVAWANEVMAEHPDREGILVTHAYLNNDDRRYDHTDTVHSQRYNPHEYATPGKLNDGEQLWQKLVRKHRFAMTLNGHVLGDGCGYLKSTTDTGTTCHQMLSNYQMRDQGGEGYMRLLEILPNGTTMRVHTYSPLWDRFLSESGHNFQVELDPL